MELPPGRRAARKESRGGPWFDPTGAIKPGNDFGRAGLSVSAGRVSTITRAVSVRRGGARHDHCARYLALTLGPAYLNEPCTHFTYLGSTTCGSCFGR